MIALGTPLLGTLIGLLIGAIMILLAGDNPLIIYRTMFLGAFGGGRQITETILQASPLLLIALGLTAAFRARVWNIGAEGQYYMGALAAGATALLLPGVPGYIMIPVMMVLGALGGGLWGLIPGLLRTRRGINEIISTLMLNYIAILLMQYMSRGPLQDPQGFLPQSAELVNADRLPLLLGSRIHLGVLIAFLFVPIIYLLLWRTPLGFWLRAVGSRASVARYAGVNVNRMILFAITFSGALAGLAGILEVSGTQFRLKPQISNGYGFDGVLIALLGRMHPVGVLVAAIFFSALTIGAQAMSVMSQLPASLASAIQAVVVLSVLATDAAAHRGRD